MGVGQSADRRRRNTEERQHQREDSAFFVFPFFVSVVPDQRGETPPTWATEGNEEQPGNSHRILFKQNTDTPHKGSVWVRCRSILHLRNEIKKVNVT